MGFWDKLFGTDNDEDGRRSTANADDTGIVEAPEADSPARDQGHHEVMEEALGDAEVRDVTDERIAPAEQPDPAGINDVIRRTPPVPMPGFSNTRNDEKTTEPAATEPTPATQAEQASAPAEAGSVPKAAPQPQDSPEDVQLLESTMGILAEAGITPAREVTVADVADCQPAGLTAFRTRPLTTVLQLVDSDGQPLLSPLHRDVTDRIRTTPEELCEFTAELAEAAGTGQQLDIRVVPDPGSTRKGSMAVRTGWAVRDVVYDLDPDFGDENAEADLSYAVAPETLITHPVVTDVQGERLTVWASKRAPQNFFTVLDAENSESCDGPPARS